MSSSSNWSIGRRRLLSGLAALPLLAVIPAPVLAKMPAGLRRWGSGSFRRFGFHIYDATLWAGEDPLRPPLALRLEYKRSISGRAIADASVKEMRPLLPLADQARLDEWGERMARIFPDVRDGDHLLGLWDDSGATFSQNGRELGRIDDPQFARTFFGIWLDANTSASQLRAALLTPRAE